jgi:hypothetical protein
VSLLCIQESKVVVPDQSFVSRMLGSCFDYVALLASGTRGGILIAW